MSLVREVDLDEANDEVRPLYEAERQKRGLVLNYHRVLAQSPPILRAILGLEQATAASSLDPRFRELAALAVYEVTGCDYQRYYHHYEARRAGLSEREVQDLNELEASDSYTATQRDVIAYALSLSRDCRADESLVNRLREALGEPALVELTVVIGLANMADRVSQALRIDLP